jgi:hypothetical protein
MMMQKIHKGGGIMTRHHGNDVVKGGFYWSPSRWEIATIPKGGGVLPGEKGVRYIRLPLVLLMLVGPFMGALYVAFLPFIGFALVLGFGGMKLLAVARKFVGSIAAEPAEQEQED